MPIALRPPSCRQPLFYTPWSSPLPPHTHDDSSLILRSGDVEKNPGPGKEPEPPPCPHVHVIARSTIWKSGSTPPDMTVTASLQFLNDQGLDWRSCPLRYDSVKEKKVLKQTGIRDGTGPGFYVRCTDVQAIDIDGDSAESHHVLRLLAGRCNLVAVTRKGLHLIFSTTPDTMLPPGGHNEEARIDSRAPNPGKKPDILLTQPSTYMMGTQKITYRWLTVPTRDTPLLACPMEVVEYVRSMVLQQGKRGRDCEDHDAAPQSESPPRGDPSPKRYTFLDRVRKPADIPNMPGSPEVKKTRKNGRPLAAPHPARPEPHTTPGFEAPAIANVYPQPPFRSVSQHPRLPPEPAPPSGERSAAPGTPNDSARPQTSSKPCTLVLPTTPPRPLHTPTVRSLFPEEFAPESMCRNLFPATLPVPPAALHPPPHEPPQPPPSRRRPPCQTPPVRPPSCRGASPSGPKRPLSACKDPPNIGYRAHPSMPIRQSIDGKEVAECPLCPKVIVIHNKSRQYFHKHIEAHMANGIYPTDTFWLDEGCYACRACNTAMVLGRERKHKEECPARKPPPYANRAAAKVGDGSADSVDAPVQTPPAIGSGVASTLPTFADVCSVPASTIKKIPAKARTVYATALAKVMTAAMHHKTSTEWLLLAMFPKCVSRPGKRGGKNKRGQHATNAGSILTALRRWDAGEYAELWADVLASLPKRAPTMSADEARVMRCEALARDGEFSKAMSALTSEEMAPCNEASAEVLRGKHPGPVRLASPCSAVPKQTPITEDAVAAALKTFPRGSSPGCMGLRAEHLRDAAQCVTSVGFLSTLTHVVNFFRDGHVPEAAQPYFAGGRLCALIKSNKDLRPIAAGETLRRLTAKALCASVKEDAKKFFAGSQFGVATKNGAERIIHYTRAQAAAHASDPDWVILKVDLSNAFNRISRARFLELVSVHFPSLASWASWCYSTESVLSFGDFIIQSLEGVQQGDPLGPLLFSLVMHVLVQEISSELPNLDVNRWFLDDGVLAGKSADVLKALQILERDGPAVGIGLNHAKCELITHPAAAHALSIFPVSIPAKQRTTDGNFPLLSSPIGTPAYCDAYLRENALGPAEKTLRALLLVHDPQIALTLLRQCAGYCQMVYVLRTTPSADVRAVCEDFDMLLLRAYESSVCPVRKESHAQVRRGTSTGGFGLRETCNHADAAYLASAMACSAAEGWDPSFLVGIQAAQTSYNKHVEPSAAVTSFVNVVPQRVLSRRIDALSYATEFDAATQTGKARLLSQSGPSASSWITVIPSRELGFAFTPREYVTLVKWWLGCEVAPECRTCAICKQDVDDLGYHALVCKKSGGIVHRHNSLCKEFAAFCTGAYLCPSREVSFGQGTRPADVFIPSWDVGQPLATDFAVTHSLQPSYCSSAVMADSEWGAGSAAAAYARTHKVRGAEECARNGVLFRPMVVEVFGSWDPSALTLLHAISRQYAYCQGVQVTEASHNVMQRMSVILQRQNVRMILMAIGASDLVHEGPLMDQADTSILDGEDNCVSPTTSAAPVVETVGPVRAPATVPVRGPPAPHLSYDATAKMTEADRRSAFAPRLLAAVTDIAPAVASGVTGMLMEMDVAEIVNMLDSPATLRAKVVEAAEVAEVLGRGHGHNVLDSPLALQVSIREASEAQKESSKPVSPPVDFSITSPSLSLSFLCEANVAPQCFLASAFDGVACAPVARTPKNKNKNKK